jgi:hypothetical protein
MGDVIKAIFISKVSHISYASTLSVDCGNREELVVDRWVRRTFLSFLFVDLFLWVRVGLQVWW